VPNTKNILYRHVVALMVVCVCTVVRSCWKIYSIHGL